MKRILSLILCVVLCLGLCACGDNDDGYHGKHKRLLAMLDKHDYQGAVNYINNLADDYAQQNKGDVAEGYVYTAALPGEWIAYDAAEDVQVPKVVFNADGTCTIGDDQYRWEVISEQQSYLYIQVMKGTEQVHNFTLKKHTTNGNITISSSTVVKERSLNFYNPAFYETVEITMDNFDDYFTDAEYYSFGTNAFDETNSISYNRHWILKDDWYARLWPAQSSVAVKYNYTLGNLYATWDLTTKTCTLSDRYQISGNPNNPQTYTLTHKFGNFVNDASEKTDDNYYGYRYMSCNGYANNEGETYFSGYKGDMELTRIEGSLWLIKEEIKNLQKTED